MPQQKSSPTLPIALSIGWMALIFFLSSQPASESSALSNGLLARLSALLPVSLRALPVMTGARLAPSALIRKAAHMALYFVLFLLLRSSAVRLPRLARRADLAALAGCILYACSDELHQRFVPGRSGELRDVLIDTAGALTALALLALYRCIRAHRRRASGR